MHIVLSVLFVKNNCLIMTFINIYLPHFSAGVGRTGTFIAIDTMMQRLEEKDDLNIYEFVTYMRTRRTFMVQNQVYKRLTLSVAHPA